MTFLIIQSFFNALKSNMSEIDFYHEGYENLAIGAGPATTKYCWFQKAIPFGSLCMCILALGKKLAVFRGRELPCRLAARRTLPY